jgi:Zn-dependent peptidase ImmA (M78 family)
MRWEEAHRSAVLAATHAHKDFGIDTTRRIDVFSVIEQAELILGFEPMPRLSGAYYAGAGILINANHPLARQRYTAGHELGHHVFGHETSVDPLVEPLARWGGTTHWPPHEKQAEAFAAWFLMPRKLVLSSLEQLEMSRPQTTEDVYSLALRLGTSFEATARHLPNLRLADPGQVKGWLAARLADVKLEIAVGAPPESLRNDVWRLDRRDNEATISVRVGDRLVIELTDIPSSGYVWQPIDGLDDAHLVLDSFKQRLALSGDSATDEDADGQAVPHVFVVEVDRDAEQGMEELVFERVRPWTGEIVARYQLALDVQRPRHGVSEEWMRIAA